MCTGAEMALLAASAAATTAGTVSQVQGQKKARSAAETAAQQNLTHQQDLNSKAQAIFQQQMDQSKVEDASADADKAAQQQMDETQALLNRPKSTQATPDYNLPQAVATPDASTPVIKEMAAKSLSDELARVQGQMQARATLQGMRQRQIQRGYDFGHAGENMQNIGNAQAGWNQTNQAQQQLAQFQGANQRMLGDVLTGLGSIGFQAYGAGLAGGAAPAASAAGTPASGAYGLYGTAEPFSSIPKATGVPQIFL